MKKILIPLIFVCLSQFSYSQIFTVSAYQWEPYIDNEAENEGVSIELINKIFKSQGHEIKVVHQPWARAMNNLEKGKVDILPAVWFQEERLKIMSYSDSYLDNRLVFIKSKDDDFEYTDFDSLKGKSIGVIREYAYDGKILEHPDVVFSIANSLDANIKKVAAKRIDLTIEDQYTAMASTEESLLKKIAFTEKALDKTPLYITCAKINPNCPDILKIFNTGLKELKDSGQLEVFLKSIGE